MTDKAEYLYANDHGFSGQFADWLNLTDEERSSFLPGSGVEALVEERHTTHGSWSTQSKMAHKLKEQMRRAPNWSQLEPSQAEALDMIATKISRVLCGNASHPDHWADIEGYARLGSGHTDR